MLLCLSFRQIRASRSNFWKSGVVNRIGRKYLAKPLADNFRVLMILAAYSMLFAL
jgi:hypothetical protein